MENQISKPITHRAHIIVIGNEKGGCGKSTAAMHVIVGLLRRGYKVGAIDLDARQGTLSRYFEYRMRRSEKMGLEPTMEGILPCPAYRAINRDDNESRGAAQKIEQTALETALKEFVPNLDVVVIDTPGSDGFLSRIGHSAADTLITPINDSFIDLDLLAEIDPDTHEIISPSIYAEAVWAQRKERMLHRRGSIDWIVMRNRLGHTFAKNKKDIAAIMDKLQKRIGFRLAQGFGERVIFRELFLQGLTLMDLKEVEGQNLSMSHIAARQEVFSLLDAINLAPPKSSSESIGNKGENNLDNGNSPDIISSQKMAEAG